MSGLAAFLVIGGLHLSGATRRAVDAHSQAVLVSSDVEAGGWGYCQRGGIKCSSLPDSRIGDICASRLSYGEISRILYSEKCVRGCTAAFFEQKCARHNLLNGPKTPPTEDQCYGSFIEGVRVTLGEDRKSGRNKITEEKIKEWCQDFPTFIEVWGSEKIYDLPADFLTRQEATLSDKWAAVEQVASNHNLQELKKATAEVQTAMEGVSKATEGVTTDIDPCLAPQNMVVVLCRAFQDPQNCNGNGSPTGWEYKGMTCENTHFDPSAPSH